MAYEQKTWISEADHAGPPAVPPGTSVSGAALNDWEQRIADAFAAIPTGGGGDIQYDVTAAPFNAVGDDSNDDTAEIQAALDEMVANGGTTYLPPGRYKTSSPLVVDHAVKAWRICGAGGSYAHNQGPTTIHYTGTGPALKIYNSVNFELDHLRIQHSNADPSGVHLIDVDGRGSASWVDCMRWHIHDISTAATTAGVHSASALRLNAAIIGQVSHCHFTGAEYGIYLGRADSNAYVVGVKIGPTNTFNYNGAAHIGIGSADAENIEISNNIFEDPGGTGYYAIKGLTGNSMYAPQILNNWFGDGSAGTIWISGLDNNLAGGVVGRIAGNQFNDVGGGCHIGDNHDMVGAWAISENYFAGSTALSLNSGMRLTLIANHFNNCIVFDDGTRPQNMISLGNGTTTGTDKVVRERIPGLTLGSSSGSSNPGGGGLSTWLGAEDQGQLSVGASGSGLETPPTDRAMVYTIYSGGNLFALALQAPSGPSGDTREVQLAAGATPTAQLRVSKDKVAFYGTAPQAKPTITGSRGGNAALASLLTALATLGLITDSTSA